MRKAGLICIMMVALAWGARAQDVRIPVNLDRLAAKASETVDVTMDAGMLRFAGKFLNEKHADEAQARKLVEGLKGIYVRSFEFDKPGEYTEEDVESLRAQLRPPVWTRVVGVRSKRDKENVDVFFKMDNNKVMGLAVIATEPRELTFVHIDGPIDPEQLTELGGQFGIPKVEMDSKAKPKAEPK